MHAAGVECGSGQAADVALSAQDQQAPLLQQSAAQQQAQQAAREEAFRAQQWAALARCAGALHGATASADAAARAGLVHTLVAEPVRPLSAPELCTLARVLLRCLLP